ncbi:MAG: GTP cyclohydrolase II [Ferrovibrio sp.]|uniref:GTP cyclohydrolase II n=1 Tax=Ferrovibrio sp. TaxID=1917215 RepID=UPI00261F2401|nr:GTP cyclohydrolase II [Ferrovibrio sp.]MCW0234463.1 GTP cyclohydrolase II [Ferrovibrio sp.]
MTGLSPSADAIGAAIAVDRAGHELRRGRPVLLTGSQTGRILVLAAETLTEATLADLRQWDNTTALVLPASRAAVLHIGPTGHDTLLLPLHDLPVPAEERASLIRDLADASRDLAAPLRGPFTRVKAAPPETARLAVKLAKTAYLLPAAVHIDLPADAAVPPGILEVSGAAIAAYDTAAAETLLPVSQARLPVADAENAQLFAFRPADGRQEHFALVIGSPDPAGPVLTRLHSECFTGDLLGSLRCDCGEQLRGAIRTINEAGGGVLLYLAQEGRGIGLVNKLRAYQLQDQGFDTVDANQRLGFDADERWFLPAARMLQRLGFNRVRLLTNNPEKVKGLAACGIEVAERVPHKFPSNAHNEAYLAAKRKRSGHYL